MRILLVHNHYGSSAPSGENIVFARERDLLIRRGHSVESIERFSDSIRGRGISGAAFGAVTSIWNFSVKREVGTQIGRFRPDVVHVHNTFPLVSPSIFHGCRSVARVLTLHNYRLFCSNAMLSRRGQFCTNCIDGRSTLPAIRNGCYRDSRVATLPVALGIELNRFIGTWRMQVDQFISLSDFQRRILIRGGLPADRVSVKPNFVSDSVPVMKWQDRECRALFVGRLSKEKGATTLVRAWLRWGRDAPPLFIIGDGPLRSELEYLVSSNGAGRIRFLGVLPPEEVRRHMQRAKLVIVPSEVVETFGLVACESLSAGTPVLASNLGATPEVVGDAAGAYFEPGSVADLLLSAKRLFLNDDVMSSMAVAARKRFECLYSEDANYASLMAIYSAAREKRKDS